MLHLQGHPIPLGATRQPVHRGRALLVGDAANLADPWLGEGIYYAVLERPAGRAGDGGCAGRRTAAT